MTERNQQSASSEHPSNTDAVKSSKNEHKDILDDDYDDDLVLDRKDLLIVKDGTVRVAESLDREQQQLDANGEVVKASGTWTKAEHERFLRAMETYPKGPWKAIAEMVATRTVRQTQTHAQKYREKLARRMRGLRNRNGTLQTPPMTPAMSMPGMVVYPRAAVSHYPTSTHVYHHAPHPGAMGYTSMAAVSHHHVVSAPLTTMGTTTAAGLITSTPVSTMHVAMHPQYVSSAMASPTVVSSPDFTQLSASTISSAFIGNTAYPSTWEADEAKPVVPDFDESMDFLMNVYSSNPNQIGSPAAPSTLTVTPTACIPRTPRTPPLSVVNKARKRHVELEFQEPHKKYPKHELHPHFSLQGEQDS